MTNKAIIWLTNYLTAYSSIKILYLPSLLAQLIGWLQVADIYLDNLSKSIRNNTGFILAISMTRKTSFCSILIFNLFRYASEIYNHGVKSWQKIDITVKKLYKKTVQ